MTEKDALTKWCPMTRVFTGCADYVAAANRNLLDRDKGKDRCIGSGCMMWRCTNAWEHPTDGHCGLAGP